MYRVCCEFPQVHRTPQTAAHVPSSTSRSLVVVIRCREGLALPPLPLLRSVAALRELAAAAPPAPPPLFALPLVPFRPVLALRCPAVLCDELGASAHVI